MTTTETKIATVPNSPLSLKEQFPHLQSIIGIKDYKEVAKITKNNMIAELKRNFPGVKFSVRKDHHSTYLVGWIDGPTSKDVEKITDMFEEYESSNCGDFRDFNPTLFNREFGGYKYVFSRREMSEQVKALLPKAEEIVNNTSEPVRWHEGDNLLRKLFCKTTFPLSYTSCEIERYEPITCGSLEDFYVIKTL